MEAFDSDDAQEPCHRRNRAHRNHTHHQTRKARERKK